ncbi:hypothetical protein CERZMDRAFT_85017 [Cercospora zeae-maydis SCOH1-5]|uniref:Uncharacterized protein n=1 Tax=Cercospora zeae-maydis SCOH1-5 TaxID=717836 RepID=A0A6A6FFI0_9PEZI|nr:hypothetical protein CERZMDRAFT_85017 [Cercospora zeae-maydis SCOH1-5]
MPSSFQMMHVKYRRATLRVATKPPPKPGKSGASQLAMRSFEKNTYLSANQLLPTNSEICFLVYTGPVGEAFPVVVHGCCSSRREMSTYCVTGVVAKFHPRVKRCHEGWHTIRAVFTACDNSLTRRAVAAHRLSRNCETCLSVAYRRVVVALGESVPPRDVAPLLLSPMASAVGRHSPGRDQGCRPAVHEEIWTGQTSSHRAAHVQYSTDKRSMGRTRCLSKQKAHVIG